MLGSHKKWYNNEMDVSLNKAGQKKVREWDKGVGYAPYSASDPSDNGVQSISKNKNKNGVQCPTLTNACQFEGPPTCPYPYTDLPCMLFKDIVTS